jgi:glycine/D-amino acid oxidase-like deaminating enzyme
MADYHFVTNWQFNAPLETVWHEIKTMSRWPEWWSYVQKVELLQAGNADDIGSVRRITWKTALPYSLTFDSELVIEEKFKRMEGRAFGELEGRGIWQFSHENGVTHVRYDWIVQTTKAWMNLLAPVARPVFAWNHDKVMEAGFEGLKKRLQC